MSSSRNAWPGCVLLIVLGMLIALRAGARDGAPAETTRIVDRKAVRPASDFPSADSYYPADASRAGQQGISTVHVCVDSAGKLTEPPTIVTSSGNVALDAGALNLANAGSGHYEPATENGVAVRGCGAFRIAFKLRGNAVLPLGDPRFPAVAARIGKLDAELTRRVQESVSQLGRPPVQQLNLAPGAPASERAIRQYARSLDSVIDESVGLTADFLDDVDYLARSPDMPEAERTIFGEVWPEERSALAAQFREMIGATRDIVRVMDELGDYTSFSAPRGAHAVTDVVSQNPDQDPQIIAIKERARRAMERLRSAMGSAKEEGSQSVAP